jgi:2-amino-4-hydroxy-6-hydroxymethyldihydropteridine diphosphokinase
MPADGPTAPAPLPSWAQVSERRRAHIDRVVLLLDRWARALGVSPAVHQAWLDAGQWHDALRDAPVEMLRDLTGDAESPDGLLHGPATAERLAADGECRADVLAAIRWHTVGSREWSATGRALYMADFLEPGRRFMPVDRAYLADRVAEDFDGTFRQVLRMRLEWALREGHAFRPETVALWNAVR